MPIGRPLEDGKEPYSVAGGKVNDRQAPYLRRDLPLARIVQTHLFRHVHDGRTRALPPLLASETRSKLRRIDTELRHARFDRRKWLTIC